MSFKNFPMVKMVVYGRGCFADTAKIIEPHREAGKPFIFLVDDYFKNHSALIDRVPLLGNDEIMFESTAYEPKTSQVDAIANRLKENYGAVSGIIGIGGGSMLDLAKAVGLMMTNPGSSADYQGWDLVKVPGAYHVGIPTLSGTGAEVSRTTVLTGPERKLGMNSDYTPFDQIILDPDLIKNAPKNQRFYTGMDCYIHCVESLTGTYLNAFSKAYGEKANDLCEEIFLHKKEWNDDSDEKLMMASYLGGMSIAYSQVGVAHALSYGLSFLLGTKHGIGNCIVFNHLEDFYPDGVKKFKAMVDQNEIDIPTGICANLSDAEFEKMIDVALFLVPLWENALGKNWRDTITRKKLREMYEMM